MLIFVLAVSRSSSLGFSWLLSVPSSRGFYFPKVHLNYAVCFPSYSFCCEGCLWQQILPGVGRQLPGLSCCDSWGFCPLAGGPPPLPSRPCSPPRRAAGWASCLFPPFYLTKVIIILVNKHLTPFQLLRWPQARKRGCGSHSVLTFRAVAVVCLGTPWGLLPPGPCLERFASEKGKWHMRGGGEWGGELGGIHHFLPRKFC